MTFMGTFDPLTVQTLHLLFSVELLLIQPIPLTSWPTAPTITLAAVSWRMACGSRAAWEVPRLCLQDLVSRL